MIIAEKDKTRFWEKADKTGDCWEWTAARHPRGYGQFWFLRKVWYAHRFSWLLHNGFIPEEIYVCHHCDNPGCVNPNHLFLGMHKDNMQDAVIKGRWANNNGEAQGNSKLTEKQVLSIRAEHKTGNITQAELARKYGTCYQNIHLIVTRQTWRHI